MHIFHNHENIKTCIFTAEKFTAVKIQVLIFSQERNRKIGTTFTYEVDNNYISFVASPLMKYKYCPLHS